MCRNQFGSNDDSQKDNEIEDFWNKDKNFTTWTRKLVFKHTTSTSISLVLSGKRIHWEGKTSMIQEVTVETNNITFSNLHAILHNF